MNYRAVACLLLVGLLLVVFLLPVGGCDKATPVAPSGTILSISANPSKIALNGSSTITVVGRKPDGNPLNPGTEIRLSASLGTIDTLVTTDRNGTATAIFRPDGRIGTATITAATGSATGGGSMTSDSSSGSGVSSVSIKLEVGNAAKTITLQPTPTILPTTIPIEGTKVTLLAIVRDSNGQPLANQGVNFTTDLGTLASRGSIVNTNARGEARDTLTVLPSDLANNTTSIKVTVQSAGSDGALINATATIQVANGRPAAHFSYTRGADDHTVVFSNQSTGSGNLLYTWDFGDGLSTSAQNPTHTYDANKQYTVQLTVTDSNNQASVSTATFTIPLAAGAGGSSSP